MSLTQPQWDQDILDSYKEDVVVQQLLLELIIHPDHTHYSLLNDIIKYKSRLYIGYNNGVRASIMHSVHSSVV